MTPTRVHAHFTRRNQTGCAWRERATRSSRRMALGIAFQLVDDALDYAADQAVLGKTVGDDFREGKITLPVLVSAYTERV